MAISKITGAGLSSITAAELGTDSVDTDEIKASAVTTVKIKDSTGAADGVTAAKIATDAVTSVKIATDAVTIAKLATDTGITDNYHKVPVYANDAARDHATTGIPSPATGMIIYNTASGALQQYNGVWSTIAPAPNITTVSGFLNDDSDSTLTIFGSNFNATSAVKMFSASSGGSQIGSNATTTFNSNSKLTAVFGAGSIGASGSTAYIEVDNSGATNRFTTAITVNADPIVTIAGATGTGSNTTTHLGTYGGASTGGPAEANTSLLLNFDRTDTSIDFEDSSNTGGTGHSLPPNKVSGNAHISTDIAPAIGTAGGKVNNSSAYFDGTGDYLSIADSADWDFGTGAFTIDFWVYPTVLPTNGAIICSQYNESQVRLSSSAAGALAFWDGSATIAASAGTVTLNAWQHIAIVRTSTGTNGLKFYRDGALVFTGTSAGDITGDASEWEIGRQNESSNELYFTGYLDVFRVSKGIARWSAAFARPTAIYGIIAPQTLPTITLTGTATQLAADEDIEFTSVVNPTKAANNQQLTDTGIGLTLTNLTGGDKNKATLTGTIASAGGTTHTNMAIKAQVRKSLGDAAYNNSTLVTFSGSTTTAGLAPGMPLTGTGISIAGPLTCGLTSGDATVTATSTTGLVVGMQVNAFTGVPAGATILSISDNVSFELSANATATDADAKLTFNTIISAVPSTTTLTLSNVTTGGSLSSQTLIFGDLARVAHVNGPAQDAFVGSDALLTIATGTGTAPVLFNARRFAGTSANRLFTGFGFAPDLIWTKDRARTNDHLLCDSIRGPGKMLLPHEVDAEDTTKFAPGATGCSFHAFTNDGWEYKNGSGVHSQHLGESTGTYISWGWKAGGAPSGVGKRRTDGQASGSETTLVSSDTIGANNYHTNLTNVTQSVNSAGDFSITKYGIITQSIDDRVCHGLSGAPDFIIIKSVINTAPWAVWHSSFGTPVSDYLILNTDAASVSHIEMWNNTVANRATSVDFGAHSYTNSHSHDPFMMYAWKAVAGVSAFGGYTGNANDKTIADVGFAPRWVMIKRTDVANGWMILDTFRGMGTSGNYDAFGINADTNVVETSNQSGFTTNSEGWLMNTASTNVNASGGTYIYCAFA